MTIRKYTPTTITPTTADQLFKDARVNYNYLVKGDPNLTAGNILSGKSIFGVAGTLALGRKVASGSITPASNGSITVTGLAFQPRTVLLIVKSTANPSFWSHMYSLDITIPSGMLLDVSSEQRFTSPPQFFGGGNGVSGGASLYVTSLNAAGFSAQMNGFFYATSTAYYLCFE